MSGDTPYGAHQRGAKGKGHPIMFGKPKPALHFGDFPEGGGYPKRFVEWALDVMGCKDPSRVLHLCSGSMLTGVRVDIRPECNPDIVADCRNVPVPDESFDFIMADPPYDESYARNLYGTEKHYPKPGQILREGARILRPGGYLGLLHFIVPVHRRPMKLKGVYCMTTGWGNAVRAWSLFQKQE